MGLENFNTDLEWIRENETKEISIDSEEKTNSTTLTKHENISDENIEKLEKRLDEINKKIREYKEMEQEILNFAKEKGINLRSEKDSEIEATKQEIKDILNSSFKR